MMSYMRQFYKMYSFHPESLRGSVLCAASRGLSIRIISGAFAAVLIAVGLLGLCAVLISAAVVPWRGQRLRAQSSAS